jgi:hypothetical protein
MTGNSIRFCGQAVSAKQIALIEQIIAGYPSLSRTELANTVCELLGWYRPNGRLKGIECRQFLESLHEKSVLRLPDRRGGRPRGSSTKVGKTEQGEQADPLEGRLSDYQPVLLDVVATPEQRQLWRELVGRYHYQGHRVPFGAHLRYLVRTERPRRAILACLQFSSPAWRMQSRDLWIGWDEVAHKKHLQRIVNNSRFLILPWVRIPHLASHVLALAARQVVPDWEARFALAPWLLETLVDPQHFSGTCYRAANWIEVGNSAGRGRNDRHHRPDNVQPKRVLVYPLHRKTRERLCGRA